MTHSNRATRFALLAVLVLALLATASVYSLATDIITAQSVSSITSTGATINWTTCGAASSQVNYGATVAYDSSTVTDPALVTSHSVALTALVSGTLYHYQVISTDSSGNIVQGADQTFTPTGAAPVVTTNPASSTTVCAGTTVSLSAAASGMPAATVQWKVSTDGGSTYTNISGATSTTYSFTAAATQNGYKYEAVFTNPTGSATSTVATLTVNTAPAVTTQPLSTSVVAGSTATFTAAASGSPSPSVQWQVSTNGGSTWTNVGGATSTTLSVTSTTLGQSGSQYRAVFTNSCGTANSSPATMTVTPATTWNISSSTSSSRSSGSFLQGASLSGTRYIFSSLASSATTFNLSGIAKICFWLDNVSMTGTASGCRFMAPFDFNVGGVIPTFVQVKSATPSTPTSPVTLTFTGAQTAGNLNIVVIGRNNNTSGVTAVTDSKGNTYTLAQTQAGTGVRQTLYYAKNIASATPGSNTVSVTFDVAPPFPDVRILEYSGLDTVSPLDAGSGGQGTAAGTASSAAALSTFANELIFGAGTTSGLFTGVGAGFTNRITTPDGDVAFDKVVNAIGSYSVTAPVTQFGGTSNWVMQGQGFRAATAILGWDTTKVANGSHTITQQVTPVTGAVEVDTASFTVSNTGHSVSLTWTRGTFTNPVTYSVYRATGACGGTFSPTRIASGMTVTSYSDTAVASATSYCYAVAQVDTVTAVQSPYSNLVTSVIP